MLCIIWRLGSSLIPILISGPKEVGANGPLVQDQVMWYSHILPIDTFATGKQKLVERVAT